MSGVVSVVEANTPRLRRAFARFPLTLYRNDPAFVAPLLTERDEFFDPLRNPFFTGARVKLFLAYRDGVIVGRISSCVYFAHNELHAERAGWFGFFDTIDDYIVAAALLKVALITLKQEGMTILRGPASFSVNHEWGFVVEGFDRPPAILMPYNRPYQPAFAERFGFRKCMDLFAWETSRDIHFPERMITLAGKATERYRVRVRPLNMRRFEDEVRTIHGIYNTAWENNWGATPMKWEEFAHLAKGLKQIVDPDLALVAEIDGAPVAFALSVPEMNQALIHLNGRLFPTGLFKLLWHTKVRNKITSLRTVALGVLPEHRRRGVDTVLILRTYLNAVPKGYTYSELSWVLETNTPLNSIAERLGARITKRYRLMEMSI